tara:strand:+ start:13366 stop:15519 length:2154 start_codon:yes stop_codon:yes gene_type:complete
MTDRDESTIDLAQQCVRIADDVVVWPVRERGELAYRLEIPALHRFFRVGYEEYALISLLDGQTTIAQACGLVAAQIGRRAPGGKQAETIQRWLLKNELAYLPDQGPPVRRPHARSNTDETPLGLLKRFNPFWIKVPLGPAAAWISPVAKRLLWCFSTVAVLIATALILWAVFSLLGHWDRFLADSSQIFSSSNFVYLFGTWLVLKLVHETAHAVACQRCGGDVHDAGIVLVLFAPLAYVDVTSCWRMNSRWSRIAVAGAGMFAELVIASAAFLLWQWSRSEEYALAFKNIVMTASVTTIMFNANVLMRFDGYHMLADAIEVPNLYAESMNAVKRVANRWLVGDDNQVGHYSGWRKWFILIYGVAALAWKVVICFTLGVAASTLFSGAGIVITAIGIVLWFADPAKKLVGFASQLWQRDRVLFVRAGSITCLCVCLLIASVTWLPVPTAVTVPAVTEYLPQTIVRSGVDGFIRKVHVDNLDSVQAGDLLIELENRELDDRQLGLKLQLAQNEIRKRQAASQRDAATVLVLQDKQASLRQQLAQIDSQRAGLRVVAHRDGQVIARDLNTKVGAFVSEGDQLLNIAQPFEKEIVAVVSQSRIKRARRATEQQVTLSAADFSRHTGKLDRIDPRATHELVDPSLAATAGGPLAVRRDEQDDGQLRLLEPHFLARISLGQHSAEATPAGMRMQASFGYRTEPLLTRLRVTISNLFYRAHDQH